MFIIFISVLLFSVVIHEVSHGAMAHFLGDITAKSMGRLTLNPLPHIDLVGTILVPLLLTIPTLFGVSAPIFGWAKPVPYNPLNLKYKKWGSALVGLAGPGSNLLLALVFGLSLRFLPLENTQLAPVVLVFAIITLLNLLLAIFNLVPLPPLDGSKILFSLAKIPQQAQVFLERNGFIFLLLFIFFGFKLILPIIH